MENRSAKSLSLEQQIASGKLITNTALVLEYVKTNPDANVYDMRIDLNKLTHQTLTSRVSDLEDEGWLYVSGQTKISCADGTDRTYTTYRYESNPDERQKLAKARAYKKYKRLKERILSEFNEFYKEDKSW